MKITILSVKLSESQIIHIHPLNPRLTEATAASKDHFGAKVRDIYNYI